MRYEATKNVLAYLGLILENDDEEMFQVQYLKRRGEKTFSLKFGNSDCIHQSIMHIIENLY